MPRVSVLLPVYNGEDNLKEAIDSVLQQSFSDFELIVISEHGTSPSSLEIIKSYDDPRIVHLVNDERLGLARSLNRGAEAAKGEYLARMDGDDISLKHRFERQVDFLDAHPNIGVLGTAVHVINRNGHRIGRIVYPLNSDTASLEILLRSPLAHPTVMIRKVVFSELGGYDPQVKMMEDYELWLRVIRKTGLCSLRRPLLLYRWHIGNSSSIQAGALVNKANLAARADWDGDPADGYSLDILRDRSLLAKPGDALKAAGLLTRMRGERVGSKKGTPVTFEAEISCGRIWLSLAARSKGGIRESMAIMRMVALTLGPKAILVMPISGTKLFSYLLQQRSMARASSNGTSTFSRE